MDGEKIRMLRERLGLTQGQLAARMHVDQGTVSRWERNVERPRPFRIAQLRDLLMRADEQRALLRCKAIIRHNLMPATLLDEQLRLVEFSKSAEQHYARRGFDLAKLLGWSLERYTHRIGASEFTTYLNMSGLTKGEALLFRFTFNFKGAGHAAVYEPIFDAGEFCGTLNYATEYFDFPPNDHVSLESVEYVPLDDPERFISLHKGAQAHFIPQT